MFYGALVMRIVNDWPPLIDEIDKAFKVRRPNPTVIFAWATPDENLIYAPGGQSVSFALRAHELVHCDRQRRHPGKTEGWWADYIADPEFRLYEEVRAHHAEYQYMIRENANRLGRRRALSVVAAKLASPLYGSLVSPAVAKKILQMGPEEAREIATKMEGLLPEVDVLGAKA